MSQNKPAVTVKNIFENEKYGRIGEYVSIFLVVLISFILCRALGIKNDVNRTQTLMLLAFGAVTIYAVYTSAKGKMDSDKAVRLIIISGIIMRIGYMIYTHMFERGHDLGSLSPDDTIDGTGHLVYIYHIAEYLRLPSTNHYQLYHPPFYHMTCAVFLRIISLFAGNRDMQSIFDFTQVVNCTVSCVMLPVVSNFLNEIEVEKKYTPWAMLIIALAPNFWLMGGRLNNDMFAAFFMMLCIINTYRWYRKRDMKSVIYLALSFGLGMMSKMSCGIMAVFTAPVMLYALYKDFKDKKAMNTFMQLVVFGVICVPLGLWYPVRNLILFDQPLTYVLKMGPDSAVYRGNLPWNEWLLSFSPAELVRQPFMKVYEDNSAIMTMLRSALYGEWEFEGRTVAAIILNLVNLVLIVISLVGTVYVLVKGNNIKKKNRYGIFFAWLIMMVSFIQFTITFPAICTPNFRYIPLTVVTGAIFIVYTMQTWETDKKHSLTPINIVKILILMYSVLAVTVYI